MPAPHSVHIARYRTVCTIDFAGGYAEHSQLVAKNP